MALRRVRTALSGSAGAPWLSTAYFENATGTALDAVTAVDGFWESIKGLIVNEITWVVEAEVYTIDPVTGQPIGVEGTAGQSGAGTNTGEPVALASQGLCRYSTGVFVGGREVRGRTFVPGLCEDALSAGQMSLTYQSAIAAAGQALCDATTVDFRVWSRKNGASYRPSVASCWNQLAVLRSRRD